ncbi:MAG TPA: enoyl-CoA hydratase/isomerase family protein [Rhizomicrobium sp.]|nr:enoyl-CoA hydratase/isomerase family protein [Rhizomicrobium sp.]
MNDVLFEQRGALGLITLNRPKALNALTRDMCLATNAQLAAWARDDGIKTVAIRGTGERAFCAGGDIRTLYDAGKAGAPEALKFYRDEYRLNAAIKHFPKPYVALLHGIVMGGGVGVSVHGSHRVANETVMFAMPETGIGLFPDVGGSYFLPRCPGELGIYLALTGARLTTADTLYAGVATHFVPARDTEALLSALEAGTDPDMALRSFSETPAEPQLASVREAIDRTFAEDSLDGILAALEADGGEWAVKTLSTLRGKSPTSLKITFLQMREGARLSFDDCMRMEFRLVSRVMAGHDFYEGVRAAIIDKNNAPRWNPAALADVSSAEIESYFAPLGAGELTLDERRTG